MEVYEAEKTMKNSRGNRLKRGDRAEETRKQILEAATRLFARSGFERTSTEAIAKEAGLSQGIIFHYFETKNKLFWTLVFEESERVNKQNMSGEKVLAQSDFVEKVRLVGRILAQKAMEFPDLNEILTRHVWAMDIRHESEEAHLLFKKMMGLEEIVKQGKASGAFKKDVDDQIAAFTLIGIFNITSLRWNMLGRKGNLQDTVEKAFDMFLEGIVAEK